MPEIGDYMVVATSGWQARGIRLVTRSKVNHAMVLVAPGRVVEADPGGASEVDLAGYNGMPQWWSHLPLTSGQRESIAAHARSHIGAPYSWVDDACIAAADLFGWHVPLWVRWQLARPDRLMCSQLVDESYREAGVHLFQDGRMPGDVAPGDLLDLIEDGHLG